jgi:magnesium/cobalt transport protein CorA
MELCWISKAGAEHRPVEDAASLLSSPDGFVWLDVPRSDEAALTLLRDTFGFHPLALQDCTEGSPLPKVHVYGDHAFAIVHAVEDDGEGHARTSELFQFVGVRILVTLHSTDDDGGELTRRESEAVRQRLLAGRLHPSTGAELSQSIVAGVVRQLEARVSAIAKRTKTLERHIMIASTAAPEDLLNELFSVRHELYTLRTATAENREVYARLAAIPTMPPEVIPVIHDLMDHFDRLRNVCDDEKELVQEVLDLFQTRIAHDLNTFAKQVTAWGAIIVTATLVAGIYGMNFSNMPELDWRYGYPLALGMMVGIGVVLAIYFKRRGWL